MKIVFWKTRIVFFEVTTIDDEDKSFIAGNIAEIGSNVITTDHDGKIFDEVKVLGDNILIADDDKDVVTNKDSVIGVEELNKEDSNCGGGKPKGFSNYGRGKQRGFRCCQGGIQRGICNR